MSEAQIEEIQERLDKELSIEAFEQDYRTTEEVATGFFQDLFVEVLNFEETPSPLGDANWQDLPVHEWPSSTRANAARLFAESGNFRVIYVELEKLTKTAERNVVKSLTRSERTSGWALAGSFIAVFHAPEGDVWHLVTPYEEESNDITEGRSVIRRYTIGEGETHHTVSEAISQMDAGKPGRLADRIDQAFRVQPVTEDFYEDYKAVFESLTSELREKGLELEDADRYAHITLNRLMFFYYLQKKGWIGGRKDFIDWFHTQYVESGDSECFHGNWLDALFFGGMNNPAGNDIEVSLSEDVTDAISDMPYMNGGLFQPNNLDNEEVFLSDAALNTVIQGFLEHYNFTITEESPYDIDVAVDPAMLGKIYESLIAEQERGEAGIFYTPRVEVDLMCRMALYEQFCDHANNLDSEGKQRIVEFIFSEPQDWDPETRGETEQLENILHELRIVDPACGSGAFLVGMKQVLTELYRKLGTTPDYHIKEQIINENLYGVDIKDWAVRVAEFRLWLSLVEGEEEIPEQRPVLPNFSFKLKVGDSLIQKLDGEFISLDTLTRTLDGATGELLTKLKHLKREHFEGEADRTEEIEEKQVELLKHHLDRLIDSLSKDGSQQTFSGHAKDDQIDDGVEKRIEDLKETRDAIDDAGDAGFFMWDIDFSDVMVEGGFDIAIGNPPYVRQEDIIDQGIHPERLEAMDDSEVSELKKQYKDDLVAYVQDAFNLKPYKKSDIYVYFFFKGLDLLRDRGTLTYITSNSWLDVNYGQRLQEGLIRFGDLKCLLDNRAGPIFDEADVNTIITMVNRSANRENLSGEPAFVTFNEYYENIVHSDIMKQVFANDDVETSTIDYRGETMTYTPVESGRRVTLPEAALWRLGNGIVEQGNGDGIHRVFSEQTGVNGLQAGIGSYSDNDDGPRPAGSYSGDEKWSQFLQAPDIYFEILNHNQDQFVTLDSLAKVFRGVTTGKNSFFYPDEDIISEFELPAEYLHPIVKSPRPLDRPLITRNDLDTKIVLIPEDPNHPTLQKYISYGEDEEFHKSSTLRARNPWYSLVDEVEQARLFWQMTHYTEHVAYYSKEPLYLDNRLYGITLDDQTEANPKLIAAILNGTYYALVKIISGREMSGRSVDTKVYEVAKYLIPDPTGISDENKQRLMNAFDELSERDSKAIFDEFDDSARRKLDAVLFDILGLSEEERREVYKGVERLTRQVQERDRQR